ncbi:hypothetical protein [Pelotalea chapellei]|uniref:Uncharacterized protein n=1 Tax=Pelotalea chapellei TaxID=44671 RepID=A0ABS5U9M9_9BACT|nr:hypothetical protein [Pelotalea chapellei]MBT1072392.1 hypothetical protein [Pelotalea chapellei]
MSVSRKALVILCSAMIVISCVACKKEGAAERAGRNIDEATNSAGKKIKESAEKAGNKIEEAGKKVKESAK